MKSVSENEYAYPGDTGAEVAGAGVANQGVIERIVRMEWDFFQAVNNIGGRASCQDMPSTFSVMRASQFSVWSSALLESYLDDLIEAQAAGRNPLAEKYGYMMASTHPDEFARIESMLPAIEPEKRDVIKRIVSIQICWAEETARLFPHVAKRGRPIHASEDSAFVTSMETYARGELATYSLRTLQLMYSLFDQARSEGANLQLQIDSYTARCYGYPSLEAADAAIAQSEGTA